MGMDSLSGEIKMFPLKRRRRKAGDTAPDTKKSPSRPPRYGPTLDRWGLHGLERDCTLLQHFSGITCKTPYENRHNWYR